MPEDFTTEQIQFLSKYLKPIEAQIKKKSLFRKKSKREANNAEVQKALDVLKSQYAEWLEVKNNVADRLARIELDCDLDKIPTQKGKFADLQRRHIEIVSKVRAAPQDAPLFDQGQWDMIMLRTEVRALAREAKAAIEVLTPPSATILFDNSTVEIDRMASFEDHPTLTAKIASTTLENPDAESARKAALQAHGALCSAAKAKVTQLRDQAIGGGDMPVLEKQARVAVYDLRADLQDSLTNLAKAVSSGANAKLQEMSDSGDAVAGREMARKERLNADAVRLTTALVKIDEKIDDLQDQVGGKLKKLKDSLEDADEADKAEIEAEIEAERERLDAMGFQEKRAILAEISAERDRRAELDTRAKQMVAYEAGAAHRLELIVEGEEKRVAAERAIAAINPDAPDLDAKLADWSGNREGTPVEQLETENQQQQQEVILANITFLKSAAKRSSEKIVVDAKLYPDEADLTEISASQYDTLLTMLTLAEDLCGKVKHAGARALHSDAMALWTDFKNSRSFVLPDLPDEAMDAGKRVESLLKATAVSIDRLWGLGGDDAALRARHKTLCDQAEAAGQEIPPDYRAVMAAIDALDRDVALSLRNAAQPNQADAEAKEKAGATSSKINESLLGLYRTEPVAEGEVGGLHPNDLLVITKPDGSKEYHKIKLRDDETVQRREDKKIPREAIDALRQQTQMLEMLAESDGAGCADAVEEATRKAEEMRAAITGGAADYKRVSDALTSFDKAMGDKKLKEWRMSGIEDLKARKDKFESSYAGSMLPTDAAVEAESLKEEAKAKRAATAAVKSKYDTVKSLLDSIENKLVAKPKGKDETLGKVLVGLIKSGPVAITTGPLSVEEMAEAQRLQRRIAASISEIEHMGQHGTGVQGELRKQLESVRKTLGIKSEQSVNSAKQSAAALAAQVDAKLAEVSINPSTDPLDYLRKIDALTNAVAKGSREKVDAQEKAAQLKEAAKAAVASAKSALDDATNLSSKVEYTAVYDSLKSQYDSANKAWNKGKGDAEAAISGFEPIISNANELAQDLSKLTTVRVGSQKVDITGFQTALQTNIGKVASAAEAAAVLIETQADQSDEQKADADLQTAIGKVQSTLRLVSTLDAVPTFAGTLQGQVDTAVDEPDPAKKKKALAKIREIALAEVRRIRSRLQEDPALQVYRDNPFDHGATWPQFEAAILGCETEVIKSLNPGR